MHHSMLPLIISCTRSWNFAWHLLWRSTSESKNIVELLAIGQTIHTPCAARTIIFQRANLNYLIVYFTQCTLFFSKKFVFYCRFVAVGYLWVVRNKDKCCVVTQRAADIRVAWLVYVRAYCVPIATLNQNKRTRLLYLGDAQIINRNCTKLT